MMSGTASNSLALTSFLPLMEVFYVMMNHILIKMKVVLQSFSHGGKLISIESGSLNAEI